MRSRGFLAFALSLLLVGVVLAQASSSSKPVFMPAADVKWVTLDAGVPGVMIADLWGDHSKGAYGAFTKFPAGFTSPVHTHTSDFRIVVISGTFIHTPEGKPAVRLGPGSYILQPGGSYKHTTACDKASECLIFGEASGAFDLVPADAAKK